MTPTIMRSTREIGGGRTEVVWLAGVRNEKGELMAWVPLGMKKDRAQQVAERKAGAR